MKTEVTEVRRRLARLAARYPYVLIDDILDVDTSARSIRAVKNYSFTEPYFAGHFPGNPVVPGVLLMMAVVQAAELARGGLPVKLLRARRFHFRSPVRPGDSLMIDLATEEQLDGEWTVRASGSVRDEVCVKGTLVLGTAPVARRAPYAVGHESNGHWSSSRFLLSTGG
jgi:3-hydroxyacyl-[acyl-carrier-protein] dehydratase